MHASPITTPAVFLSPHATPCAFSFVSDPAQLKFTPLCVLCSRQNLVPMLVGMVIGACNPML